MKHRAKNLFDIFRIVFFKNILAEKIIRKLIALFPESIFSKLPPNHYQYTSGSIRKFKQNQIVYTADISDYMGHFIYFGFKDLSLHNMLNYVKTGDTIIDVGTNIGVSLLNFAKKTGNTGKVIGFEPDSFNFNNCKKNIALNKFNNIELINEGLGNKTGNFNMIIEDRKNRGRNKITNAISNDTENNLVSITTLDIWFNQNKKINKLNILKIDVEGYDLKVIQGALTLINQFNPIIFVELDDNNLRAAGNSAEELILFMNSIHYKCYKLTDKEEINTGKDFTNCHYDLVCIKK